MHFSQFRAWIPLFSALREAALIRFVDTPEVAYTVVSAFLFLRCGGGGVFLK